MADTRKRPTILDQSGEGIMAASARRIKEKRDQEARDDIIFDEENGLMYSKATGEITHYVDEQGTLRRGKPPGDNKE